MRILFIGSVQFSASALLEIINMKANVVGVCTLETSILNSDHFDLTPIAREANIPVCYTPEINSLESLKWIRQRDADVIFCFGWSQLIRAPLLTLPKLGIVGFHPSELPANRGRHPLIWALVLGLSKTASTFFFMDEGPDSGDILSQVSIDISENDNAGTLYKRVTEVAIKQIQEFVPRLADRSYQRQKQEASKANVWRRRGPNDGLIDWRMSAESIYNLVRGLTRPYIGAHFEHAGSLIKVWHSEPERNVPANIEPGKILAIDSRGVLVKAGIGGIRLLEIAPQINLEVGNYL